MNLINYLFQTEAFKVKRAENVKLPYSSACVPLHFVLHLFRRQ
jgi:hypothetical protein